MVKLGVNVDHVATVRQARRTVEPDPVTAALLAQEAKCDSIVCHLRKDRRHINDIDLARLKSELSIKLNLEMSVDPDIVDIACRVRPDQATLVPENRQEVTTEGGLDVCGNFAEVKDTVEKLTSKGIKVSLFIDPDNKQIEASKKTGVEMVELHTGRYAEAYINGDNYIKELDVIKEMSEFTLKTGLLLCAGHGLTYKNAAPISRIRDMYELNIGHSIVSRAVFVGIASAVREMRELIRTK